MVQVEEVLDVSRNAEDRLAFGPANPNAPTPIGNQQSRCLKLALSDGYYANGLPYNNNRENQPPPSSSHPTFHHGLLLIAMEVSPIPALSSHSLAGLKLILTGPLHIRRGVLMCHAGNTIVLGGHVDELVDMQRQAMQKASRRAGIGVDPTVRALVNQDAMGTEEDASQHEEEGEEDGGG